jgi:hypothetical protein
VSGEKKEEGILEEKNNFLNDEVIFLGKPLRLLSSAPGRALRCNLLG